MKNIRPAMLPFSRPSIGEEEVKAVTECLTSGWITAGPKTGEFETSFAKYVGAPFALAVTSATAGLHLVLESLDLKPGDEVITPSLTWLSVPNMIVLNGGKPVFVDVETGTRNIDASLLERAITTRTRAMVPVHFAGQAFDLDPIRDLCHKRGIMLIEDAAHAVGTEYKGKRVGNSGETAIYSFHPIKNMTTGEGGMITTHDAKLVERLKLLRWHGLDKDPWKRNQGVGRARYDTVTPGWKYNFTDLQATMGLVQLRKLDRMIEKRTHIAERYMKRLAEVPGIARPQPVPYAGRHAWHLYTILIESEKIGISRDDFMEHLKALNVGTGLHFLAVHQQSFYKKNYPAALPNSDYISERILSLPLFPDMTEEDADYVVSAIQDVIHEHGRGH